MRERFDRLLLDGLLALARVALIAWLATVCARYLL
jgi:hypothetical protein